MKFDDLGACPFCGSEEFYEKQKVSGTITYYMCLDAESRYTADNTDMYNSLDTHTTGRAYCASCERYLGNYLTGVVGKDAEREHKKRK